MVLRTVGGNKRRVYLCFDYERDRQLRDFFLNQGRHTDATWYVTHWSQPYADTDPLWMSTAANQIKDAEAFVIMLGPGTHKAPGVLKEVNIARQLDKPIYQIVPPTPGDPHPIPRTGRVVRWEWQAVKRIIATAPRRGNSRSTSSF